jgi:hypothetical protein
MAILRKRGGKRILTKGHAHSTEEELLYTTDEMEFLLAMDHYKRDNHRPFPSWSEVLNVFKTLGYHKNEPVQSTTDGVCQSRP